LSRRLRGGRIDVEGHVVGDAAAPDDLGGDGEVAVAGVGRGTDVGLVDPRTRRNMLTLQYARAFAADPGLAHIKINAVTPGYVATDMNRGQGMRTVAEGATVVVEFATLGDDGPTGEFHNDRGPVPW
jgi:NAD(P)-dependent dehydrogenase (short-subunit alcohol dehydrogenase family)